MAAGKPYRGFGFVSRRAPVRRQPRGYRKFDGKGQSKTRYLRKLRQSTRRWNLIRARRSRPNGQAVKHARRRPMCWYKASQSSTRIDLNCCSLPLRQEGACRICVLRLRPRAGGMPKMGVLASDHGCARVRVARRAVRNRHPGSLAMLLIMIRLWTRASSRWHYQVQHCLSRLSG
jgi:hypothetical protein